MRLTKTLIKAYRNEYETTEISLEALLFKYGIEEGKIDTSDWQKRNSSTIIEAKPSIKEPQQSIQLKHTELPKVINNELVIPDDIKNNKDKIDEFKNKTLDVALAFIKDFNPDFHTIRDLKDMQALVDSIEKSYLKAPDDKNININVAIQNIMQNFKDDC